MKRAFVTGGNGFTGSWLIKELIKQGYEVMALIRKKEQENKLKSMGAKTIIGDLKDKESLANIIKDIDIVFHIAALYRQEGVNKEEFFKVNLDGTKALLQEALKSGVKTFVHCSTVGVQGEIKNPPADENAPFNPGDHYQESKLQGELAALDFAKENDKMKVVVVRPVGIYGPGDTRFLKLFKHINKGNFRMIGKGKALYHLTFVEDLVKGIILAGEKGRNQNVYTIGGPQYLPLDELVEITGEILGKKVSKFKIPLAPVYVAACLCEFICRPLGIEPPLFRRRLDFFTKDRAFSIEKAKKELGFAPQTKIKEGFQLTAKWYKEQGLIK